MKLSNNLLQKFYQREGKLKPDTVFSNISLTLKAYYKSD